MKKTVAKPVLRQFEMRASFARYVLAYTVGKPDADSGLIIAGRFFRKCENDY